MVGSRLDASDALVVPSERALWSAEGVTDSLVVQWAIDSPELTSNIDTWGSDWDELGRSASEAALLIVELLDSESLRLEAPVAVVTPSLISS